MASAGLAWWTGAESSYWGHNAIVRIKAFASCSGLPVLPGETRRIALSPVAPEGQPAPELRFPLRAKGSLESGKARLPLDASFAP